MSTLDLPPDVKAKAAANDPSTQNTVTFAQISEGADALESYLKTGELGVEECFKAAVESLGVEVAPPPASEATAEANPSAPMTLAFTDTDDHFIDDDFCAASISKDQLHAKIQRHVKFLNSLSDVEL